MPAACLDSDPAEDEIWITRAAGLIEEQEIHAFRMVDRACTSIRASAVPRQRTAAASAVAERGGDVRSAVADAGRPDQLKRGSRRDHVSPFQSACDRERRGVGAKSDALGPEAKAPQTAPKSIRHENPAETLLGAASTSDSAAKASKRWPERDTALVATFCVTGIRLSEAIRLDLDSITGPAGARRLQVRGKGNRDRAIPIEPTLEALIDRYLGSRIERQGEESLENPGSALFVHYDGTRLTRGRIQYLIERIYERAGLRSAVPKGALVHALRHTFASQAIEDGTDVVELRDILGHASVATTSRYLDANAQRLREAVAAHPAQRALKRVG